MTGYELLQKLSQCDLDLPVVIDVNETDHDAVACLMETQDGKDKITIYFNEDATCAKDA